MCCIIYKPKGTEMPSLGILNKIMRCNHDGYGFVSTRHHFKSLDYHKFLGHLANVGKDEECLIHMRLATHGSVCKYNCHPFRAGNIWFMHNGILNIEPIEDRTDSETSFLQKIYPVIQKYGFNSMEAEKTINSVIGCSRFAFMHNGKVSLYGSYQKLNGVYYSNMRWASNKLTFGIMFENKA